jgi:hypothetical protein
MLARLGVCNRQPSTEIVASGKQNFSAPLEIFRGAEENAHVLSFTPAGCKPAQLQQMRQTTSVTGGDNKRPNASETDGLLSLGLARKRQTIPGWNEYRYHIQLGNLILTQ